MYLKKKKNLLDICNVHSDVIMLFGPLKQLLMLELNMKILYSLQFFFCDFGRERAILWTEAYIYWKAANLHPLKNTKE